MNTIHNNRILTFRKEITMSETLYSGRNTSKTLDSLFGVSEPLHQTEQPSLNKN